MPNNTTVVSSSPRTRSKLLGLLCRYAAFYCCICDWKDDYFKTNIDNQLSLSSEPHPTGNVDGSEESIYVVGKKNTRLSHQTTTEKRRQTVTKIDRNFYVDSLLPANLDSKRLRYINLIKVCSELYGALYISALLLLRFYIQKNIVNDPKSKEAGHLFNTLTSRNSSVRSEQGYFSKINASDCSDIVDKNDYIAYFFILMDPLVSLDALKVWLYPLELVVIVSTLAEEQLYRFGRRRIIQRFIKLAAILDSGFDGLIDDYLQVLANKDIHNIRIKVEILQRLVLDSYNTISRNIATRRFYPVINLKQLNDSNTTLDYSDGDNDNMVASFYIDSTNNLFEKTSWTKNHDNVVANYLKGRGQPEGLSESRIRIYVILVFGIVVTVNLFTNVAYVVTQYSPCAYNLNYLQQFIVLTLKVILINIYYFVIVVHMSVVYVLYFITMKVTIDQIQMLHKAMNQYGQQFTTFDRSSRTYYRIINSHMLSHVSAVNVTSDINLIISNLLRINNYIIWKIGCYNMFFRMVTTFYFVWLIAAVIAIVTYFMRFHQVANLFEICFCCMMVGTYFLVLATYNTAAILNKKVTQYRAIWSYFDFN